MDRAKGFACSCRELAARARFGALATVAGAAESGWPFATLVAVSFDALGRPLLLLSRLAEHTKNLEACPRASLLVSSADIARESLDPLAQGRMTLVGECRRLERGAGGDAAAASDARARFLTAHPEAAGYASFPDFDMWRLEVAHVRWVGGFGAIDWVSGEDYAGAVSPGDSGERTC
jgi:putative heme iron utilization protein